MSPLTLTLKLNLEIIPLQLHTEIQVCLSVTHTDDVKTITPYVSQMWGVKMTLLLKYRYYMYQGFVFCQ